MEEQLLEFIVKLVEIGLGYYLVHNVFSKRTKDFHASVDQNGVKVDSSFYKE
jgi:hypothetical protein